MRCEAVRTRPPASARAAESLALTAGLPRVLLGVAWLIPDCFTSLPSPPAHLNQGHEHLASVAMTSLVQYIYHDGTTTDKNTRRRPPTGCSAAHVVCPPMCPLGPPRAEGSRSTCVHTYR
jgi:hypothetical protein